ncbi:MAG: bifunctional glutamate N-acetyltransferase/amino-acid acetyltransferase ArgJ [Gammaproteobacteria bacterium]
MAVNLSDPSGLLPVAGVRLGSARAGIRYRDRDDLVVMAFDEGSSAAGVFTRNAFCAAPVHVARANLLSGHPRLALINSGNANAGTGEPGMQDARESCAIAARLSQLPDDAVLPFSTGVIGTRMNMAAFGPGIDAAIADLDERGWDRAARAIMTTDTVAKAISRTVVLPEGELTITGMAKGAGMIRPDMATMLAFVATDAGVDKGHLERVLKEVADASFNAISVDGDTSTNDALLLVASGASGIRLVPGSEGFTQWQAAVLEVCQLLAQAIVRDGEGATKFITVRVRGGRNREECRSVAYTVAHSPLVKTAFFASDANWGRILAAVGRSGLADMRTELIDIHLDEVCIVRAGGADPDYSEERGAAVMKRSEIVVTIDLGRGAAESVVWTTDLSHDYVTINAEYRT